MKEQRALGVPVVPLVYMIVQMSSAFGGPAAGGGTRANRQEMNNVQLRSQPETQNQRLEQRVRSRSLLTHQVALGAPQPNPALHVASVCDVCLTGPRGGCSWPSSSPHTTHP